MYNLDLEENLRKKDGHTENERVLPKLHCVMNLHMGSTNNL